MTDFQFGLYLIAMAICIRFIIFLLNNKQLKNKIILCFINNSKYLKQIYICNISDRISFIAQRQSKHQFLIYEDNRDDHLREIDIVNCDPRLYTSFKWNDVRHSGFSVKLLYNNRFDRFYFTRMD